MKRKEFMEKLCSRLSEFEMEGYPAHNAFPCICGHNKMADDSSEVCAETARKILRAIEALSPAVRCPICFEPCRPIGVAQKPEDTLYVCNNPNCHEYLGEEW